MILIKRIKVSIRWLMNNSKYIFSEVIVKKSKFLGFAFYISKEKDIKDILNNLKKEYKKAKHIVYAYRLGNKEKAYNDKEPVNSAGKPLLYLLQKKDLNNHLLVVIRYFGGIKLGVGGLIRAYTHIGKESLEKINGKENKN